MRKIIHILIILLAVLSISKAQTNSIFIDPNGAEINFINDSTSINISISNTNNLDRIVNNLGGIFPISSNEIIYDDNDPYITVISDSKITYSNSFIESKIQTVVGDIECISYSKKSLSDTSQFWLTNYIVFELNKGYSTNNVSSLISQYTPFSIENDGCY
ncbi:MAG: hypothetical protein PHW82_14665 [Bacteroidales bacterium]|nr:hypothetical protein [Bacteroidales bacterium]